MSKPNTDDHAPTSVAEFEARYMRNRRIEGRGFDTVSVEPCPFCGAADFRVYHIIDVKSDTLDDVTCRECGRSSRVVFTKTSGSYTMELVQSGGDDLPDWYEPKPRRVEPLSASNTRDTTEPAR